MPLKFSNFSNKRFWMQKFPVVSTDSSLRQAYLIDLTLRGPKNERLSLCAPVSSTGASLSVRSSRLPVFGKSTHLTSQRALKFCQAAYRRRIKKGKKIFRPHNLERRVWQRERERERERETNYEQQKNSKGEPNSRETLNLAIRSRKALKITQIWSLNSVLSGFFNSAVYKIN